MAFTAPQHFTSIENALESLFGRGTKIARSDRVSGGDINDACKLTLTNGASVFMKSNAVGNAAFFTAEAVGLQAIAQTGCIGTPRILCSGTEPGVNGYSFLLLEWIDGKRPVRSYWECFAQELAAMHRATATELVPNGTYGFLQDNYIGAGSQCNAARESWVTFFRDCRLEPQFQAADFYFTPADRKRILSLLDHLADFLTEPERPSLLHGDLWSGNVMTGNDGRALLIDPAVYVGHAEADLAMTELFGGFSPVFYAAYKAASPLQPGYRDRRDLYNLYHLLNHLNLFGGSYLSSVLRTVRNYT
ncbi:MAG: fructosamine kinase family protein [Bacteroidales bacterium]|nr:fructosamine kinase family protein [Bacteroidales bacterium]MCM1415672.1 fructosamine kinase family protein [bacterium]MCM1423918.1 fructosamine kinase family protein [bacterium]